MQQQNPQSEPKEKAAASAIATASVALKEQNVPRENNSTKAAESQVAAPPDVRKLFWRGVWQLFRYRAAAEVALAEVYTETKAAIAEAEAAVAVAEDNRNAVAPAAAVDQERLDALALVGLLTDADFATAEAGREAQAKADKAKAGRRLGLAKGRLTKTNKRAEAAVAAVDAALAEIQERLDLLEAADSDLYAEIVGAWASRGLRIAAEKAARVGDLAQARELLAQALTAAPETDENTNFYGRTRKAIEKAERKVERARMLNDLTGRIQKAAASGRPSALTSVEQEAKKAGVYDQIAGALKAARAKAQRNAVARAKMTQEQAVVVAAALGRNGGKGKAVVTHTPGEIKVYTRNGKGFILAETQTLRGKRWNRREESGMVTVTNIPVNGVVVRV